MQIRRIADSIRKIKNTTCSVVIVAAGSSQRMGADKLFLELDGMPVLARSIQAFQNCSFVDEIVVVTREESLERVADLRERYGFTKVKKVVLGGKTRSESSLAGLTELSNHTKLVLIHDGARPLVTEDVIYDAMHQAAVYKCAAPGIPVTDTIKEIENGEVTGTLSRERLIAVQTPQGFSAELVKAALTSCARDGITYTDDCAAVEALGIPTHISKGSPDNIKITTPLDILTARSILTDRGN